MMDEVVREAQSHLSNVHRVITRIQSSSSYQTSDPSSVESATPSSVAATDPLIQIQKIMCQSVSETLMQEGGGGGGGGGPGPSRHPPIIVCGDPGSGKTCLLSQVFTKCSQWLESIAEEETEAVRIVRLLGRSPTSSYAPELLRSLCQQVCLEFAHLEMHQLLSDYESSLSIRFQVRQAVFSTTCISLSSEQHVSLLLSSHSLVLIVCVCAFAARKYTRTRAHTAHTRHVEFSICDCLHCFLFAAWYPDTSSGPLIALSLSLCSTLTAAIL